MELIITYYDIKKAYDRANMDDMLYVVNEQGFQGKIWRLTKSLNKGLTAKVKTKVGPTREIQRITEGKQGGKKSWFPFLSTTELKFRRGL